MNQPTPTPMIMPGMAPPASGSGRFTPVDPIRVVKQYKWLLLASVVVGVGLGIGAYFLLLKYAPRYTATRPVSVRPEIASAMQFTQGAVGSQALEMFKQTQALYIRTEPTLRDAINTPEVLNSPWFADFNGDKQAAYEALVDALSVIPVPETQVINVSVTTRRATDAPVLANAVVDTYIAWNERVNRNIRNDVEQVFKMRRNRLEEQIQALRNRLNTIMDEGEVSTTQGGFDETVWLLQTLLKDNEELKRAAAAAESSYAQLVEAARTQAFEFTPEELYQIDSGPVIRGADNKILYLREELRVARERLGEDHRSVQMLRDRIRAAEAEKEQERQRLLNQFQDVKIAQAQSQLAALRSALADNEQRLVEVRQRQRELREQLSRYEVAQEDLDAKKEAFQRFDETLSAMDIYRDNPNAARVESGVRATPPQQPSSPEVKKVVPAVTFIVVALVAGLVFLRELLDSRIKSPSDTRLLPNTNLLGVIPEASEDPSSGGSIDRVVARKPAGLLAENFRQLRTEVMGHLQRHRYKTLMVVGCQPRGGNTSITTNLATSLAYNGRRVLVVDANFRRPAVHEQFDLTSGPGLAELVSREADVDQVIRQTDVTNLDAITIGDGDEHILERVESDAFTQALRTLEERYDLILIDAPPLSIVGDSRVLANRVDAVMLTVRALEEKRGLVARLIRQLDDARAEFIGIVLNGVQSSAGGYFRRNYEAFYEYQNGGRGGRGSRRAARRAAKTPAETAER